MTTPKPSAEIDKIRQLLQDSQDWAVARQAEVRDSIAIIQTRNVRKGFFLGPIGVAFFGLTGAAIGWVVSAVFFSATWLGSLAISNPRGYWQSVLAVYSQFLWIKFRYIPPGISLNKANPIVIYTYTCFLDILAINAAIQGEKCVVYPAGAARGWVKIFCNRSGFIEQSEETLNQIMVRLKETPNLIVAIYVEHPHLMPPESELNPLAEQVRLSLKKPATRVQLDGLDATSTYRSIWTHLHSAKLTMTVTEVALQSQ